MSGRPILGLSADSRQRGLPRRKSQKGVGSVTRHASISTDRSRITPVATLLKDEMIWYCENMPVDPQSDVLLPLKSRLHLLCRRAYRFSRGATTGRRKDLVLDITNTMCRLCLRNRLIRDWSSKRPCAQNHKHTVHAVPKETQTRPIDTSKTL